jgi:hypothetical protein
MLRLRRRGNGTGDIGDTGNPEEPAALGNAAVIWVAYQLVI